MKTKLLNYDQLETAAEILRNGGIVAFPTETVYGLGANALDETAVAKIFAAKGRPSDNPLIVHISERDDVHKVACEVSETAKMLMDKFWGGPLTLVLKRQDCVPDIVTAGLDTVAVRMPSNKIALEIIRLAGVPIAAPSANISGKPSPTAFEHVKHDLNGRVDSIVDGGSCDVGLESTVIDMTREVPVILRPGGVSREQIEGVIGEIDFITNEELDRVTNSINRAVPAPGMKYKHYSPNAKVVICRDGDFPAASEKIGILKFDENNPEYAARILFAKFREFDDLGVDVIYVSDVPNEGMWAAVRNRLYKAAGEI